MMMATSSSLKAVVNGCLRPSGVIRNTPLCAQTCRFFSKKKGRSKQFKKKNKKPKRATNVVPPRRAVAPPADSIGGSSSSSSSSSSSIIPPALLLPTASPHVFVAKIAAERAGIDPTTQLFTEFAPGTMIPQHRRVFVPLEPHTHFGGQAHPPDSDKTPRVAFLGRSNVGKSSLLNALMRKPLAVTSKQPGRTQKVHYYGYCETDDHRHETTNIPQAYFVDLPGYGYAVGPDDAVQEWQRRTQQFLLRGISRKHDDDDNSSSHDNNNNNNNNNHHQTPSLLLRHLYLLQDARIEPQPFDHTVQAWLEEAHIPHSIVLTKADGVRRPADLIRRVNDVCMQYHSRLQMQSGSDRNDSETTTYQSPVVHVTSAKTGSGIAELWSAVEADLFLMEED